MSDNLNERPKENDVPKETIFPRVEVKKLNGKMFEYHYIDKVTMVTREVESSRAKLTVQP